MKGSVSDIKTKGVLINIRSSTCRSRLPSASGMIRVSFSIDRLPAPLENPRRATEDMEYHNTPLHHPKNKTSTGRSKPSIHFPFSPICTTPPQPLPFSKRVRSRRERLEVLAVVLMCLPTC